MDKACQAARLVVSEQKNCARRTACDAFVRSLPASNADWVLKFPAANLYPVLEQMSRNVHEAPPSLSLSKWSNVLPVAASVANVISKAKASSLAGRVKRVQWAGSLAKDTAVVGNYDLDIVVIINHFVPAEYPLLLTELERHFRSDLKAEVSTRSFADYDMKDIKTRAFVTKLNKYLHIKPPFGPSVDVLLGGEYTTPQEMFRVDNKSEWWRWSASCASECVQLLRSQSEEVRVAIRAVKSWRDALGVRHHADKLSSFAIELLCISVARSQPRILHAHDYFDAVMEVLCRPNKDIAIKWSERYPDSLIPSEVLHQRPLLLDPFHPGNNLLRRRNLRYARGSAKQTRAIRVSIQGQRNASHRRPTVVSNSNIDMASLTTALHGSFHDLLDNYYEYYDDVDEN
jgi:hypothetical protein